MKAIAIFTATEQVGPDVWRQVYHTKEVELPDDFLTPDGVTGLSFVGLSFNNGKADGNDVRAMSGNGKYRILCRCGLVFGYLGNEWMTVDDKEAYEFDSIKEAEAKMESVRDKAKAGYEGFGGQPLELTIVKIEKVCKAT